MIAADFCLLDGILQRIKIEEFSIAIDDISDEGISEIIDLYQIRDGLSSIAGCFNDFNRYSLPGKAIAISNGSADL